MPEPRVLFVCLGNICRSPFAEGLLRYRAAAVGLGIEVDSAGTDDTHEGASPQAGSQAQADRMGFDISALQSRPVKAEDFERFTHIIAMDRQNEADLRSLQRSAGGPGAVSRLMTFSDRPERDVLDPYGMDAGAFRQMAEQIESGINGLLADLRQAH